MNKKQRLDEWIRRLDGFPEYDKAVKGLRREFLEGERTWGSPMANRAGLQLIPDEFLDYKLPRLETDFTPAQLEEYRKFADVLDAPCGSR